MNWFGVTTMEFMLPHLVHCRLSRPSEDYALPAALVIAPSGTYTDFERVQEP